MCGLGAGRVRAGSELQVRGRCGLAFVGPRRALVLEIGGVSEAKFQGVMLRSDLTWNSNV